MATYNAPFRDKNSERYMYAGRIERMIETVEQKLVLRSLTLDDYYFCEGQETVENKSNGNWTEFPEGSRWGAPEYYCRFKHSFTVPEEFKGGNVFYEVMPLYGSGRDSWRTSDAQFIIFANGKLIQGCDSNHKEVLLLDNAQGGETYDMHLNAYLDKHEYRGQRVFKARIKQIDPVLWKLIFDLKTPLEIAEQYGPDDMDRVDIIKELNTAVNLLVIDGTHEELVESAKKCMDYLDANLYGKMTLDVTTSGIGHTHIDVAWLWRLRQTREKAGRSFATVLKLMEEYPEYKFMSSQAQLYEYVKEDYPEVYEGIKKMVKEGRWEVEGGMWVEPDTNVPSGESLVRQFLVGKRFFKQEFDVDCKIMWEPDVFGYSAALPQIIRKAGCDYFMTTKISWNEYNRVPFDTFMWKGIDGTEVLSHFSPSRSGDDVGTRFMTTYNAYLSPSDMIGGWHRYSQKDLNNNVLMTFGWGDGGGGPTREMLEYGRRLNKGLPGCPKFVNEPSLDFYKRLEEEVGSSSRLPTWVGELYLEFHRATLTSQAANKKNNRKSEILLHDLETIASIANIELGEEYPRDEFTADWKCILLHQFHDILPGSSINEVYEDSDVAYGKLLKEGKERLTKTLELIAENVATDADSLVVFNTLGKMRNDVVITDMPENENFIIVDENGNEMKWQKTYDGKLCFLAENVPAKGYKVFNIKEGLKADTSVIDATASGFETKYLKAEFNADYNITSLIHKGTGRDVVPAGEVMNRLIAYDDRPHNHEAWDVKAYYKEISWNIDDVQSAEIIENGSVRAVYKVVRKFRNTIFNVYIIVYADTDRVDVAYDFDWKETHILIKVDNPVDVNAAKATFDIQFGNIERNAHDNTLWEFAQFEVSGHKWIDLSENGFGFSLLNDSKYGHDIKDGRVRTSLIRASMEPCHDQDKGPQYILTALYPHAGLVCESDVVDQAFSLNVPLHCVKTSAHAGKLDKVYSLVSCNASNVVVETVKIAEDTDEVVIRAYETWNKRTSCEFSVKGDIKEAHITNLMEENEEEIFAVDGKLSLTFHPFEIKTIKIKL